MLAVSPPKEVEKLERIEIPPLTKEESDLLHGIENRVNIGESTVLEFLEFIRRRREAMDEVVRKAQEEIVKAKD